MFFLIRTVGRGSRGGTAQGAGASWLKLWAMCFLLAVPIAGVAALFHAVDHHAPPAPIAQLVTFSDGSFSSYGTPSFRVAADNSNAAPVTVHSVTVEFVNDQTGRAIATVTEQAGAVVIPGGQSQAITGQAPAAVANAGTADRWISVTVTGWS